MAIIQDVYQLSTEQFQQQIGKVQADYNATAKGADNAAKEGKKFGDETAKGAKKAEGELKKVEKQTGGVETAFKKMGAALGAAFAVSKIKQFVTASIQEFANFEGRLANVATLVDTNVESIDAMGDKLLEISGRVPVSVDSLAASLYDVRSAGISSAQAMDVLEQSARLGVAGLATTEQATNLMTSAMNAFASEGMSAEQIADILFKTVKAGKTDLSQLATAFGATAPAIQAAGISLADFQAATAALTTLGTPASQAQNQLRAAMIELQKPGKELSEIFTQLGVSSGKELIETSGSMGEAFRMIAEQAAVSGKSITQVTSSVEAAAAITALSGSVNETYTATLADMVGGLNAVDEAFEKQNETVGSAMQRISNSVTQAMILIGEQLAPAIRAVADAFSFLTENNAIPKYFDFIRSIWQPIFERLGSIFDSLKRTFAAFNSEGESSIDWLKVFKTTVEISMLPLKAAAVVADNVARAIAWMAEKLNEFIGFARAASAPVDRLFTSLGKLGNWIGSKFSKDVELGVDQLGQLRKSLEGLTDAEKIARLQQWRKALKDNEAAVKVIDAEIAKLSGTANKLLDPDDGNLPEAKRGFEELRKQIELLRKQAEDEAFGGFVSPETIQKLRDAENQFARIALRMDEAINGAKRFGEVNILPDGLPDLSDILGELPEIAAESVEEMDAEITEKLEAMFGDLQVEAERAFVTLGEGLNGLAGGMQDFSGGLSALISAIGDESGDLAAFTKALAIFDVAMKQGQAIAAAIAGATAAAAATGPGAPFVLAGYIASMIGTVVAGFGQVAGILSAEPPRFFEGTASVERGSNPVGRDTIPALLNEGEAVIPTDDNRAYPGMSEAWIRGDLDRYIHKNWVAPHLKAAERERAERELNAIGQMMVQGFDDYRLHKDNREMIGVMRSGFDRLSKNRPRQYQWGSK